MESPIIFLGDTRQRSYSSSLRISISRVGTANTKEGRVQRILRSRGAFKFLPVLCSNDLVHGSWWMVWGSLLSAIMPIVPLIDIYCPLFHDPEGTVLAEFGKALTWILCIISGICFTVGSAVYVRAFEDPPLRPLFENFYHFQTDELLASWLFLFAMLPAVPYSLLYLIPFPYDLNYIGFFMTSLLFIAGSLFFVYTCYPSSKGDNHETHSELLLPIFRLIFGSKSSILKHVQTDWLAATWFMFWATFFCTLGSYFLVFYAQNDRQLFVYITGEAHRLNFITDSLLSPTHFYLYRLHRLTFILNWVCLLC
jgi:hypothetical protein